MARTSATGFDRRIAVFAIAIKAAILLLVDSPRMAGTASRREVSGIGSSRRPLREPSLPRAG